MATGATIIQERAAATAEPDAFGPTMVETMTVTRVDTVSRTERYVGEIEAARSNALGFERGGTLTTILVDEGDWISEGDILARLDTSLLEARRAELEARQSGLDAQIALARLTFDRQSELREMGHASEQIYDQARFGVDQLIAGRLEVEAGLLAVTADLAKSVLIAPFDGQVTSRSADEGAIMAAGTPVLGLIEARRPQLRVGVPAVIAADLALGQTVRVTTDRGVADGAIAVIRPDIDRTTRSQMLLIDLPEGSAPAFGQVAELLLDREIEMSGFWVPVDALRESARGLWSVLTVIDAEEDAQVVAEVVEILFLEDDLAFVRGTLRDGAEIISTGAHRLVPGGLVARVD